MLGQDGSADEITVPTTLVVRGSTVPVERTSAG
jgi:hypothetical protein